MTVTGLQEVTGRLRGLIDYARVGATEKTLTEALIMAGAHAAAITPVATSTLINSQGREVQPTMSGYRGTLYYGAFYAPFVHEKPGTLKGLGVMRYPASDGFVWGPDAEPEFLKKGTEQMAKEDLPGIIQRNYGV